MLNIKEINKNITLIKTAGKKLDDRVQNTLVSIFNHAEIHGDWTAIQRLYDVLPKVSRRKAFVRYTIDHSPLNFDDKLSLFAKSKNKARSWEVEKASKVAFWDYTVEIVKAVDVDKMLIVQTMVEQAVARLEKAQEAGAEIKGDISAFQKRVNAMNVFQASV